MSFINLHTTGGLSKDAPKEVNRGSDECGNISDSRYVIR